MRTLILMAIAVTTLVTATARAEKVVRVRAPLSLTQLHAMLHGGVGGVPRKISSGTLVTVKGSNNRYKVTGGTNPVHDNEVTIVQRVTKAGRVLSKHLVVNGVVR